MNEKTFFEDMTALAPTTERISKGSIMAIKSGADRMIEAIERLNSQREELIELVKKASQIETEYNSVSFESDVFDGEYYLDTQTVHIRGWRKNIPLDFADFTGYDIACILYAICSNFDITDDIF